MNEPRMRRAADAFMIFRMMMAAGALLGALAWPFFHAYIESVKSSPDRSGVDWRSIAFYSFCLLVILLALSPELSRFNDKIVEAIRAWKGRDVQDK